MKHNNIQHKSHKGQINTIKQPRRTLKSSTNHSYNNTNKSITTLKRKKTIQSPIDIYKASFSYEPYPYRTRPPTPSQMSDDEFSDFDFSQVDDKDMQLIIPHQYTFEDFRLQSLDELSEQNTKNAFSRFNPFNKGKDDGYMAKDYELNGIDSDLELEGGIDIDQYNAIVKQPSFDLAEALESGLSMPPVEDADKENSSWKMALSGKSKKKQKQIPSPYESPFNKGINNNQHDVDLIPPSKMPATDSKFGPRDAYQAQKFIIDRIMNDQLFKQTLRDAFKHYTKDLDVFCGIEACQHLVSIELYLYLQTLLKTGVDINFPGLEARSSRPAWLGGNPGASVVPQNVSLAIPSYRTKYMELAQQDTTMELYALYEEYWVILLNAVADINPSVVRSATIDHASAKELLTDLKDLVSHETYEMDWEDQMNGMFLQFIKQKREGWTQHDYITWKAQKLQELSQMEEVYLRLEQWEKAKQVIDEKKRLESTGDNYDVYNPKMGLGKDEILLEQILPQIDMKKLKYYMKSAVLFQYKSALYADYGFEGDIGCLLMIKALACQHDINLHILNDDITESADRVLKMEMDDPDDSDDDANVNNALPPPETPEQYKQEEFKMSSKKTNAFYNTFGKPRYTPYVKQSTGQRSRQYRNNMDNNSKPSSSVTSSSSLLSPSSTYGPDSYQFQVQQYENKLHKYEKQMKLAKQQGIPTDLNEIAQLAQHNGGSINEPVQNTEKWNEIMLKKKQEEQSSSPSSSTSQEYGQQQSSSQWKLNDVPTFSKHTDNDAVIGMRSLLSQKPDWRSLTRPTSQSYVFQKHSSSSGNTSSSISISYSSNEKQQQSSSTTSDRNTSTQSTRPVPPSRKQVVVPPPPAFFRAKHQRPPSDDI